MRDSLPSKASRRGTRRISAGGGRTRRALAATLAAVAVLVVSAGPPAIARTDPGHTVEPATVARDAPTEYGPRLAALYRLVAAASASAEPAGRMGALRFEERAVRDLVAGGDLDA